MPNAYSIITYLYKLHWNVYVHLCELWCPYSIWLRSHAHSLTGLAHSLKASNSFTWKLESSFSILAFRLGLLQLIICSTYCKGRSKANDKTFWWYKLIKIVVSVFLNCSAYWWQLISKFRPVYKEWSVVKCYFLFNLLNQHDFIRRTFFIYHKLNNRIGACNTVIDINDQCNVAFSIVLYTFIKIKIFNLIHCCFRDTKDLCWKWQAKMEKQHRYVIGCYKYILNFMTLSNLSF